MLFIRGVKPWDPRSRPSWQCGSKPRRYGNCGIMHFLSVLHCYPDIWKHFLGGGPRVVVSTAAFHATVRGSVPGLGGLKETKMFLPHPRVKVSIVESLRDREVACSASDRQGSNFASCVWRTVSSQSSHHPQEVLLAQFSLYVHKGGLKPDSFHFIFENTFSSHKSVIIYWRPGNNKDFELVCMLHLAWFFLRT